jgi:excisionase family DNA binding protein
MSPEYLTAQQVADRLQISVRTVWKWTAQGKLPQPYRVGNVTRWRADEIDPEARAPQTKKHPVRRKLKVSRPA